MNVSEIHVEATDGFPLAATLYEPADPEGRVLMVSSATGVRRSRYHEYASYLTGQGWSVITFDYRGIGGSRSGRLRGFPGTMRDWGAKDVAGMIEWVDQTLRPSRFVVVGHSVGGQVLAFAGNHQRVDALLTICAQNGYWRLWDGWRKYAILGFWLAVPAIVRVFGYLPLPCSGCDSLPAGVGREWSRWGLHPDFIDERRNSLHDEFAAFRAPILALSFTDDPTFAPRRAVEALIAGYCNAPREHRHVDPREWGLSAIGHSGFFRSDVGAKIWRETSDWLKVAGSGRATEMDDQEASHIDRTNPHQEPELRLVGPHQEFTS